MPEGDQSHPRRRRFGRWLSWSPDLLVVAILAFAVAAVHFDLGARWGISPDPRTDPAAVAPPLELPALRGAGAVALPLTGGTASSTAVAGALATLLDDPRLGAHRRATVTDLSTGQVVFNYGTGVETPASTMKLLTSVAALDALGPQTRFSTRVVRAPAAHRIVLVGGGDPYLAAKRPAADEYPRRADIGTLARVTAIALRASGTTRVSLGYDDSRFSGPRFSPTWPASYRAEGVVPPISALWVDQGRADGFGYVADPSRTAATTFAVALRAQGITVVGEPVAQVAPRTATRVASVVSPTVGQIVSRLLLVSDNNAAEVMAHQVGVRQATGGSFAGGAAGVRSVLTALGVRLSDAAIHDGSGLSRKDRLDPGTLLDVLRVAASPEHPRLRQVVTGLPVAGFSGSLRNRFDTGAPSARGRVQAKTGTLTGVHGLAGIATDRDGDVLGFVLGVDRVAEADNAYAQAQLDRIAAALSACACRERPTPSASPSASPSGASQTPVA